MNATAAPLRYRGFNNVYVDIAKRAGDEHLGFSIEYAVHPANIGCFILRFIVHGKDVQPKNYKHLTYRESAKFLIPASEENPVAETFKGVRLNKIAIKAFQPAVQRFEVEAFADKFNTFALLTEWVAEQVQAEGFTLTLDLAAEIRAMVSFPKTDPTTIKSVIEFPNLGAPEQKEAALKLVQKPVEDDEDEDTDGDEDDEPEEKEWLN